jgi:hypothetical protein
MIFGAAFSSNARYCHAASDAASANALIFPISPYGDAHRWCGGAPFLHPKTAPR